MPPPICWCPILPSLAYGKFTVEKMTKSCCRREKRQTQGLLVKPSTLILLLIRVLIPKFRGDSVSGSSRLIRCHVRPGEVPEWGPN